jgi:hypothetical protein
VIYNIYTNIHVASIVLLNLPKKSGFLPFSREKKGTNIIVRLKRLLNFACGQKSHTTTNNSEEQSSIDDDKCMCRIIIIRQKEVTFLLFTFTSSLSKWISAEVFCMKKNGRLFL